MSRVLLNNSLIDFQTAVELMDDELREKVHAEQVPCTDQDFMDAYVTEHFNKYGSEFRGC